MLVYKVGRAACLNAEHAQDILHLGGRHHFIVENHLQAVQGQQDLLPQQRGRWYMREIYRIKFIRLLQRLTIFELVSA